MPAACTALSGFKPTLGRIPFETANDGFGGFAHIGLMAKHVTDVREAFAVMEGPHRCIAAIKVRFSVNQDETCAGV